MTRLQWLTCWDRLRIAIEEGKASWGKNELLKRMTDIERDEVRKVELDAVGS